MRSRIILRITYVENPAEAAKAIAILKRGMVRAIYRLVDETRSDTPDPRDLGDAISGDVG